MPLTTRHFLLIAAVCLSVLGCRSPASPTSSPAKNPSAPVVLRLGFFPNVTHAAALVGTESGRFQQTLGSSIRLEPRVFSAGPAEIEALFAGEIDLGYIGPGPALNGFLKSRGAALRIVAGAASGGAGLVARAGVPIRSIADLRGRRVAVPQTGGTQDISLRHALATAGLTARDHGGTGANAVDVVQIAPADTLAQFQQNTVDAAWLPEPWISRLEAEGGARMVVDERDLWPNHEFASAVVIARREFLEQHPDVVRKFLAAHVAVIAQIRKSPDEAARQIGAQIKTLNHGKGLSDAVLKSALARVSVTTDPLPDSLYTFADWSKELGYQRVGREALGDLIDSDIVRP